jgi:hypothetical protein
MGTLRRHVAACGSSSSAATGSPVTTLRRCSTLLQRDTPHERRAHPVMHQPAVHFDAPVVAPGEATITPGLGASVVVRKGARVNVEQTQR